MKIGIALIIAFIGCIQALEDHILLDLWKKYKTTHDKVYLSNEHEKSRYEIFKNNVDLIEKHNSEHSLGMYNYTLGLSQFTDWTFEEFQEKMLGTRISNKTRSLSVATFIRLPEEIKLPESIDWREKGVVTPVKNQGQCGSCWSFSATGALEGQHARSTGQLVSLSEQQLVDCSQSYGNEGCNGGLMDNAFKYIQEIGGLDSEDAYPYDGEDEDCKYDAKKVVASCNGFVDVPQNDDEAFKEALATIGPISVAIAVTSKFMHYKEGVFSDHVCSEMSLNHGVLAVGYGVDEKTKAEYWLVKNSWGNWGEEGYIRMARAHGACGITKAASYPLV